MWINNSLLRNDLDFSIDFTGKEYVERLLYRDKEFFPYFSMSLFLLTTRLQYDASISCGKIYHWMSSLMVTNFGFAETPLQNTVVNFKKDRKSSDWLNCGFTELRYRPSGRSETLSRPDIAIFERAVIQRFCSISKNIRSKYRNEIIKIRNVLLFVLNMNTNWK